MTVKIKHNKAHLLYKALGYDQCRNDPSPKSEEVHETKFNLKISYSTHVCLAELDRHHTCKSVMISCEFKSHWRQIYFLKTPQC